MLIETEHTRSAWSLLQREQELAQLERFVDNVEHQVPTRQIVVTGAAGTGRTALLREMCRRVATRGRSVGVGQVEHSDGLPKALVDALDEAIGTMIKKRPGAPALARMQQAITVFAETTLHAAVDGIQLASAVDLLLPSLMFDRDELQAGYLVTIDDLQLARADHVNALMEGLVTMAVTGAPLGVIVSGSDALDIAAQVSEPSDLELVALGAFDHAAVRSIVSLCGVSMLDGGLRRLEELTQGKAGELFPLLSELSLRRGNLGAADVDEVRALLLSDARVKRAGHPGIADSLPEWSPPWGPSHARGVADPVPVSLELMQAALNDAAAPVPAPLPAPERPATPFVPRLIIATPQPAVDSDVTGDDEPFDPFAARVRRITVDPVEESEDTGADDPFAETTAIEQFAASFPPVDVPAFPVLLVEEAPFSVDPLRAEDVDLPVPAWTPVSPVAERVELPEPFHVVHEAIIDDEPVADEAMDPFGSGYNGGDLPAGYEALPADLVTAELVVDEPVVVETVVAEIVSAQMIPEEMVSEEIVPEEMGSEEVALEEFHDDVVQVDPGPTPVEDRTEPAVVPPVPHVPVAPGPAPALRLSALAPAFQVSPSQRRVLRTVADLREQGAAVTVDAVRRQVGDLNRFTGVSPVVQAVDELLGIGLLQRRTEQDLELTSAGVSALLASA